MTTQQIKFFLTAAKQLNFTSAAQCLFVSQPTLSRQIGMLEAELNTTLFNRVNNNLTLTPAGELLLKELTALDSQFDRLHFRIAGINCGFSGVLRLAVSQELLIPPVVKTALGSFREKYPEVEISLQRMEAGPLFESLYNCTVDIGVNSRENKDVDAFAATMDSIVYEQEPECLALRRDHAAGLGSSLSLEQCAEIIRRLPLYMPSVSGFNNPLKEFENDAFFMLEQKPGATPQRLFRILNEDRRLTDYRFVKSIESVFMAVECGLGCTFTVPGSRLSLAPDIVLIPVDHPENDPGSLIEPVILFNPNNANPPAENYLNIIRTLL